MKTAKLSDARPMAAYENRFKVLLGYTKKEQYGERRAVYLEGFEWDCNWYWAGGYIGNNNFHAHFGGAFLNVPDIRGHVLGNFVTPWTEAQKYRDPKTAVTLRNGCAVWEDISTFLDDVPAYLSANWWRIKDLYKQFYALKEAAEVFQYGGHCSDKGRTDAEIRPEMARAINEHIGSVIIPAIVAAVSTAAIKD